MQRPLIVHATVCCGEPSGLTVDTTAKVFSSMSRLARSLSAVTFARVDERHGDGGQPLAPAGEAEPVGRGTGDGHRGAERGSQYLLGLGAARTDLRRDADHLDRHRVRPGVAPLARASVNDEADGTIAHFKPRPGGPSSNDHA